MENREIQKRHKILKSKLFWLKLEFEISGLFGGSQDPGYRKYWVDGFFPSSIENTKAGAKILGMVCMANGSKGQERFQFVLHVPQRLLYRHESNHEIVSVDIDEQSKSLEIEVRWRAAPTTAGREQQRIDSTD